MKVQRLLPALLLLNWNACAHGVRGVSRYQRRKTNGEWVEHEYPFDNFGDGTVDDGRNSTLHDDMPEEHDVLDPIVAGVVGGNPDEMYNEHEHHHEGGSRSRGGILKHPKYLKRQKRQRHQMKSAKKTKSPMPTVSPSPSAMPSVSNQPSVSPSPSMEPSVTPMPSITPVPTDEPTITPMPSVSGHPTDSPVEAATTEEPAPTDPPTVPDPIMNKFAIMYDLPEGDEKPVAQDYQDLSTQTGEYLDAHFREYYEDIDHVIYVDTNMTSWYEPSPFVLDYDSVTSVYYDSGQSLEADQLDGLIAIAFTTGSDDYIEFLENNLPSTNPFSRTKSIEYSPYWSALAAQRTQSAPDETITDEGSNNAKIIAPIVAIGGTLIVIAGVFVFSRQTRRRRMSRHHNDNRWDEKGANLHMMNGNEQDDTKMLDAPSVSGNSYTSRISSAALETLPEEDEESIISRVSSQNTPEAVMREMNLTSALVDVDLSDEGDTTQSRPEC